MKTIFKKILWINCFFFFFLANCFSQTFQLGFGPSFLCNAFSVKETYDTCYVFSGISWPNASLTKVDKQGNPLWINYYSDMSGSGELWPNTVVQTADSGFIMACLADNGSFGSSGSAECLILVIKTDKDGNLVWSKSYGSGDEVFPNTGYELTDEVSMAIQQTTSGNYVLSYGMNSKIGLLKIDKSGNLIWAKNYANTGWGGPVCQTSDNGFVMAGTVSGDYGNVVIIKTDSNGVTSWSKSYGSGISAFPHTIIQASDGGYVVSGWQGPYNPAEDRDFLLLRVDALGVIQWTKVWGFSDQDEATEVIQDAQNNYIVVGFSDPVAGSASGADYQQYIAKINASGSFIWQREFGKVGTEDHAQSVIQAKDGGYVIAGGGLTSTLTQSLSKTDSSGATGCGEAIVNYAETIPNGIISSVITATATTITPTVIDQTANTYVENDVPTQSKACCPLHISPSVSVCAGIATTLTVIGGITSTTVSKYTWSPSTYLNSATGSTVISTPGATTAYLVSASGCTNKATTLVSVVGSPTLAISANSTICLGSSRVVSVIGSYGSYSWSPSSVVFESINGSVVIATPTINTTYTVTETSCDASVSVTVDVNALPLPTLVVSSSTTVCLGNSTVLSVTGALIYTWNPATSLSSNTGSVVTSTPSSGITYTISGIDNNGCMSSNNVSVYVSVNPLPVIYASPSLITVCSGNSTMLSVTGTSASLPINYQWNPNTGLSSNITNTVTATVISTTTYSVIGTDAKGCYNTTTAKVNVNSLPTITIIPANVSICSGASTTLSAIGANIYVWNPSIILNNTKGTSITTSPINNTTYTITGTDNNGCSNQATANLVVYALPIITLTSNETICAGVSTVLSANGAISYVWTPSTTPSTGQIVTISPNSATTYTVIGTDQNGCTNEATIKVNTLPASVITVSGDVTIYSGETIDISGTSNGASYTWMPATSLSCNTCSTTTASPTVTTKYYITADNGSCGRTDSIIITVKHKCGDVFIPNAFSPNGDEQNDILYFKTLDNNCIQSVTFEVFDRWGVKVFITTDASMGWDGKYKGKEMDPAVFVYNFQANLTDGSSISKKGNVSLIR